jgi:hypothetical protein
MDKVQKLSSNECYTPSSEPFVDFIYSLYKYIQQIVLFQGEVNTSCQKLELTDLAVLDV